MLVSVIIPAYNSELTIDKTLQSVFEQDYNYLEIIVINDGSTDATLEKLEKYKDKVQIYSQKNAGVSSARNFGLSLSKGDFIQYLDADDILAKGKISSQVNALVEKKADVAYGDWIRFKEDERGYEEIETVVREMKMRPEIELITDFWIPLAALLYSRSIVNKIGDWNVKLPIIQDARYALDAALNNAKFIYTPGVKAFYRVHQSGSLSTLNKISFMNDCFENARQIDKLWRNDYTTDEQKKASIIKVLRFCVNEFSILDKKKFKEAVDLILEIEPKYIPDNAGSLNTISKILGYRNAERIAYYKRKLF